MALIASRTPYKSGAFNESFHEEHHAFPINLAEAAELESIVVWIKTTGAFSGTITWQVLGDAAGVPDDGNIIAAGDSTDFVLADPTPWGADTIYKCTIPATGSLSAGVDYWVTLKSSAPASGWVNACLYETLPPYSDAYRWLDPQDPWAVGGLRVAFEVYAADAPPPPAEPDAAARPVGVRYSATLTGAADSLPDYSIRLSAFSARLKSGTPSTVTLAAIWQADAATAIAARPNGDLLIQRAVVYSDGTEAASTLVTVGIDELRTDQGSTRRSITITGSRQTTNASPKTVALVGVSYRADRGGSRQLRAAVNPSALAGDTFTYGADSLVASSVVFSVANGRESMEIVE